MLSVTIDRSSLSLSDLVIGDMPPASGFWLPPDGIGRPEMSKRRTYAGTSPWVAGQVLTASVKEQASQPLAIMAQAATIADLHALMDELDAAVDQFTYDLTVAENGAPRTWAADPADLKWGDITLAEVAGVVVRADLTIPVYPVSA